MRKLINAGLLIVSLCIAGALFLLLDWLVSANSARPEPVDDCMIADEAKHHAYKPNCSGVQLWGRARHPVATNSLGLLDGSVRTVIARPDVPRILLLGDSFTAGLGVSWKDSFAGILASSENYDVLNGAVTSYSPSNYLILTKQLLRSGVAFDEVIVFIDISDIQDEASHYQDTAADGVALNPRADFISDGYARFRFRIRRLIATNMIVEAIERVAVWLGYYRLPSENYGDTFDLPRSAWTYRAVDGTSRFPAGYAPLGVDGGIEKALAKMSALRDLLAGRGIRLGVVVYPWPAQLVNDSVESRQVRIWRDWCGNKCSRFVSAFPDFHAVKNRCPSAAPGCWYSNLFIFGDVHFTGLGHRIVADRVSDSLERHPPRRAVH